MYPYRPRQFTVPHTPGRRTLAKLACIFSICFAAAPLAPALDAGASSTSIGFTLGSTSTVLGPTWHIDMPFSTHGTTPNAIGYTGNTMTWGFTTSNLLNLTPLPGVALAQGTSGNFDGCSSGGAWLNSTYTDPSNPTFVRGWYHAENGCNSAATASR